jgi:Xaa-Pro dipeptidase
MTRAGELVSIGIDAAIEQARPGITELELKRRIEGALWEAGAESVDIVLVQAGANSAAPHHRANQTPLQPGQCVLVDIAARMQGYFGDITQQVFLGRPPDDYVSAYNVVHAAQEAGVRQARAGATAHEVAAAASKIVTESDFGRWNGPSTGHGIGVDVHEPPRVVEDNQMELRPGMVITVEPGVYIPGRFGIRIEDTVLVTEGEPRRLTRGSRPLFVKSNS